uniref:BESS domain-containing protein n=1 Tax=Glossina pallidipes TaxID=7398 RepID=A0A1B0A027_GLOPL
MSGYRPGQLIREIKARPGIYDKEHLQHPKREHKHKLWLEVAECLTPDEDWEQYTEQEKEARIDEIQLKWKHMRDHFYREIKLQQAGEAHKKRKYVYFDDMEFMRPFVGFKLMPLKIKQMPHNSDDEEEEEVEQNTGDEEVDCDDYVDNNVAAEEEVLTIEPTTPELRRTSKRIVKSTQKNVLPPKRLNASLPASSKSQLISKARKTSIIKNFDALRKSSGGSTKNSPATQTAAIPHTFKIRDGDISFCLSLVPTLRKLSESQKLRAKIEILKVLHKTVEAAELGVKNQNPKMVEHHLEDDDDQIHVKDELNEYENGHEDNDPLTGSSGRTPTGNTKTWWT